MDRKFENIDMEVDAIVEWMRNYAHNANSGGFVVGLSGGVDSAVVAALAVKAVGNESVHGLIMPIESNTLDDKLDAELVAQELGIEYDVLNLEDAYQSMMNSYPAHYETQDERLMGANVKARLRMTALYQFAGEFGYLVAGTGNRSEDAIGYFTKYGDGGVDILPIAQFYKWEVRKLAEYFGYPDTIYNRTSTAGLWEGQTDEEDLGITYDVLDAVLMFLDGRDNVIHFPEDVKHEERMDIVAKVVNLIHKNNHKANYPPIYERK